MRSGASVNVPSPFAVNVNACPFDFGHEHTRGADVDALGDRRALQRRRRTRRPERHQRLAADLTGDDTLTAEIPQRDAHRVLTGLDPHDAGECGVPTVDLALEEEGHTVDVVVPGIRVASVVAIEAGVSAQHDTVRVRLAERRPRDRGQREHLEVLTRQLADDALAGEVAPERLGLPVVHDERRVVQQSRRSRSRAPGRRAGGRRQPPSCTVGSTTP